MLHKRQNQTETECADLSALEELIKLAGLLNQCETVDIIKIITERAAGLLKAEHAFLYMLNPRTRETMLTLNRFSRQAENVHLHEVEVHTSGWIMKYHQSLLCPDLLHDERFGGVKFKTQAYTSAIGIPLMSKSLIMGSLVIINKANGSAFTQQDLELLEKLGQIVAPFMRNTQEYQAFFEKPLPDSVLIEKYAKLGLLGKSEKFISLLKGIESAAACDVRVLLQGASGTGKELVAQAIHKMSSRWSAPFVAVDCGALAPSLVESELMGHVKGAFTGAAMDRKGLFEAADRGTLFMDEIVNLPMEMQSKLLRVLQEGEVRPVGSDKSHKINVRVITAASASLEKMVESGKFREDLYYRLYVFPIVVPSLHERKEDIGLLADHFLLHFAEKQGKQVQAFHSELIEYLKNRPWPGNIRELENLVERLVTLVPKDVSLFSRNYLPDEMRAQLKHTSFLEEDFNAEQSLAERMEAYEARLIRQALQENDWNQSRAARLLRMPVQTLHHKIIRLKIKK